MCVTQKIKCPFCGRDYTNTSYRERIHHSNNCGLHNLGCVIFGFRDCKTESEKLTQFYDTIGLEGGDESYQEVLNIYDCVVGMLQDGLIDDEDLTQEEITIFTDYIISQKGKIKDKFNSNLQYKIDEIKLESERKIRNLESKFI